MNVTFLQIKQKILRALNDEALDDTPLGGGTYAADLLKDAVHAALDAVTARIWKTSIATVEGDVEEFELPGDAIDVEAVYDSKLGIFLPEITMQIGSTLTSASGNGWISYPDQSITFINPLGSAGGEVYYSAHWTLPDKESDLIEPPRIVLTCLVLYAASYCLLQEAVAQASLGSFKTKVDSGQPVDNPAKEMSDFFLRRYEHELQRLPMMEKGRTK